MVTERPILFSGGMVRALLSGSKTMTRRIVKPRHDWNVEELPDRSGAFRLWPYFLPYVYAEPETVEVPCPYGEPGDQLWVKETWAPCEAKAMAGCFQYRADGQVRTPVDMGDGAVVSAHRGLTLGISDLSLAGRWIAPPSKWRPSIFMLRRASRLSLRITDVRVERLQDISEFDAIAEGVEPVSVESGRWRDYMPERKAPTQTHATARESFLSLWESINGTESLAANPWVWCVSFEKVKA